MSGLGGELILLPEGRERTLKALVTGATGFAGRYLVAHLLEKGMDVAGLTRTPPSEMTTDWPTSVELYECDLRDAQQVQTVVAAARPDLVFHLAAQASVARSWEDPEATLTNNVLGQLHLFQAVLASRPDAAVLVVGSDEEYGTVSADELPVRETQPFRPSNPYAVSKVAQDLMGYQYFVSHGLRCTRVRPFNHVGPGQGNQYVTSSLAHQVAQAEAGLRPPVIRVGNLEVRRDFTDVRDTVRAYVLALQQGEPGEVYNVGSGRMVSIQFLFDYYLSRARVPIAVETDPSMLRRGDTPFRQCDASKLRAQTGWRPEIPLERTLDDILDYWRAHVKPGS